MPTNVIGHRIRELRQAQGLTQDQFVARLGRKGWDLSRGTLAKIEAKVRTVRDHELIILAQVLRVSTDDLYR